MLKQVKNSLYNVCFTQNFFSFLLYSCCVYKALDFAPILFNSFFKKLKKDNGKNDFQVGFEKFGKYSLPISRCMFFRDTLISCVNHKEAACLDSHCLKESLRVLFDLIRTAEKEILLCCYTFSYMDLANVVLEAADRGVKVKIITNFASTSQDSAVVAFHKKRIPIKMTESTYIFHHKFFILDRTVLINGSTNFTDKGIFGNYDSLLVTSDRFFVDAFIEEFDLLWESAQLTY